MSGAIISLLLLPVFSSLAGSNYNSSRSNTYRLIYPSDVVSSSQAAAILKDLETTTQQGQARVNLEDAVKQVLAKHWLPSNFKKIIIKPPDAANSYTSIILLSDPADEAQALAVSDEGAPGDKPAKGKKTN